MSDQTYVTNDPRGPITKLETPSRLEFLFTAGTSLSKNLAGYQRGQFIGQKCPVCSKVYVPSRGSCPVDGVALTEVVDLPNTGTMTTFCVVNVPFAGQSIKIPYIAGQILLDGANLSFMGLIQECELEDIRMGMRVEAVWVDEADLVPSLASVRYFRPTGEPDADYETYREYL